MSYYIPVMFLLIILLVTKQNERAVMKQIMKKRKTEDTQMYELARNFVGKECIIYTFNSQLTGTINQLSEGGIILEKDGTKEAVNFDFIVRIREYPKKKNGKKKSVVLD